MAITHEPKVLQRNDLQLWAGVLLGPIAWILDEGLSYSLEQHACSTGHFYVLHVFTVVTLIIASSGVAIAWRQLTVIGGSSKEDGRTLDRSRWMARLGIALGIGFAVVIIALAVPKVLLNPCS